MRFSATGSADEYGVALAREEAAGMEVRDCQDFRVKAVFITSR
jgi:hypothetical protein